MMTSKNRKVIFLGDVGVGKTSLIYRLVHNSFDASYSETIGVDYLAKTVYKDNQILKVEFWDTAGQEKFRSLMPSYIRNCSVAILTYETSKSATFSHIQDWAKLVKDESLGIECIIVGNKIDQTREVSEREGKILADDLNSVLIETSALTGEGIDLLESKIFLGLPSVLTKRGQTLNPCTKQHKSCGCL